MGQFYICLVIASCSGSEEVDPKSAHGISLRHTDDDFDHLEQLVLEQAAHIKNLEHRLESLNQDEVVKQDFESHRFVSTNGTARMHYYGDVLSPPFTDTQSNTYITVTVDAFIEAGTGWYHFDNTDAGVQLFLSCKPSLSSPEFPSKVQEVNKTIRARGLGPGVIGTAQTI